MSLHKNIFRIYWKKSANRIKCDLRFYFFVADNKLKKSTLFNTLCVRTNIFLFVDY